MIDNGGTAPPKQIDNLVLIADFPLIGVGARHEEDRTREFSRHQSIEDAASRVGCAQAHAETRLAVQELGILRVRQAVERARLRHEAREVTVSEDIEDIFLPRSQSWQHQAESTGSFLPKCPIDRWHALRQPVSITTMYVVVANDDIFVGI